MDDPKRLIPMRWPAAWSEPSRLAALEGEPINCLLFDDPAACAAVRQAALRKGFAVEQPASVQRITEGIWPGLARQSGRGTVAAPTGPPWLDSNGWRIRLAQTLAPGKPVWIDAAVPSDLIPMLGPQHLALAVADAAAYGAIWVFQPWPSFDLASTACRTLFDTLKFFEAHADWRGFLPWARLGIVSSFQGDSEFLSGEVLNLASRRGLAYRALLPAGLKPGALAGLRALLLLDEAPPPAPDLASIHAFVQSGGLVIAPSGVAQLLPAGTVLHNTPHGYRERGVGKGRVAEPVEPWSDPYEVAGSVHALLSRRNDYAAIFNAQSMTPFVQQSPDGRRTLIHLPNYALRSNPGALPSVRLPAAARKVRWYVAPLEESRELPLVATEGFHEVQLPDAPVYSALSVE